MPAQGGWRHITLSTVLACLLSDIDHPKSFLGQQLSQIPKPVTRAFSHRDFTRSLLAVFGALTLPCLRVPDNQTVPVDTLQSLVLGCLSHTFADVLTPAGVPLLWSCRWHFRLPILVPCEGNQLERALCMALFIYAIWMSQTLADNSAARWPLGVINSLQITFNRLTSH